MDNKKKKILWGLIIILVIAALVWLVIVLQKDQLPPSEDPYSIEGQPVFKTESKQLVLEVPPAQASTEFTVTNLAKTYVARFGSWSTDNQGKNLDQLMSLSTASMQEYLQNIEINYDRPDFYGVATKSMSSTVNNLDEDNGQAEIVVHTQRVENNKNTEEKIYYQDVVVNLVQAGDQWLVNQVSWQ